jgi:shikimate dehydrogenase
VTLHARSLERARPVAAALGVSCAPLEGLEAGRHRLIINATPLGLHAGDASPVPAAVFDARTVAFDMIYDPAETDFLAGARAAGAETIPGREMLISQALVQFRLFTGEEATYEELEASFIEAQRARRG